jgi:arylsulfatase A-like enzyme
MDHLPTLCGLANIEVPSYVDGTDQGASLRGERGQGPDAVLMMNTASSVLSFKGKDGVPVWRGVKTARFTYLAWREGADELYDDREDPYQLRNLAGEAGHQKALTELRERLGLLMASANDDFPSGSAYADWFDPERRLLRTALGPVPSI